MNKKIGFVTLGCKVNIYESNALKNELIQKGYEVCEPEENCDAYIINTCSVTNMADAKSRRMVHRLSKMNPKAVLCVMGCYSQTNPEALDLDGVDILLGNGNKLDLIPLLEEKLIEKSIEKKISILNIMEHHQYENLEVSTYDHTRAFVKIEDGCENFCTYCIIPYARGPVRSKNANDVINEMKRITSAGYKEIVLAGIHTGRYLDGNLKFSGLIRRILNEVPELERLRLSSIEINEIDDDFIEMMKNNSILANHLHLPLQSGSDTILTKMERRYDLRFFEDKINQIRKARPDISITTDVIVGFPYETEEEYQKSKQFIEHIHFSKIHVFPYSVRRGTKAALMPQIDDHIKKERAKDLISLSSKLELEYAKQFLNTIQEVIFEQKSSDETMTGHTSNYLEVCAPYEENYLKKKTLVKIVKLENQKIIAEIMKA